MGVERARGTKFGGSNEGELVRPTWPHGRMALALRDLGIDSVGLGCVASMETFAMEEERRMRSRR